MTADPDRTTQPRQPRQPRQPGQQVQPTGIDVEVVFLDGVFVRKSQ